MNTKPYTKLALGALLALGLVGCGSDAPAQFTTREIPEWTEDVPWEPSALDLADGSLRAVPMAGGGPVVNALAGVAQKVIGSTRTGDLSATIVGHGMPANVSAFDLQGCREKTKGYEKVLTSLLGLDLVRAKYKVSFVYGCKYQGKGAYLANARFTPVDVETDPLWSLSATAVSEQALNTGSAQNPEAQLKFAVSFTADGVGTKTVTDVFTLHGKSGEIGLDETPFE